MMILLAHAIWVVIDVGFFLKCISWHPTPSACRFQCSNQLGLMTCDLCQYINSSASNLKRLLAAIHIRPFLLYQFYWANIRHGNCHFRLDNLSSWASAEQWKRALPFPFPVSPHRILLDSSLGDIVAPGCSAVVTSGEEAKLSYHYWNFITLSNLRL